MGICTDAVGKEGSQRGEWVLLRGDLLGRQVTKLCGDQSGCQIYFILLLVTLA